MNERFAQPSSLHLLYVDCAQHDKCADVLTGIRHLEITVAKTPYVGQEVMELEGFDCVLVRFDPGSHDDLEQLNAVQNSTARVGIPLVGMSTFNVSWIENLMVHLGVHKHFRQFPSYDELVNVLIEHTKLLNGQAEGVAPQ